MDIRPGGMRLRAAASSLVLTVPDAPQAGYTVTGEGFSADTWIWVTVEDLTAGTKPVDGPDAFQPADDGTFTRIDDRALSCGHELVAKAWVGDQVAATSATVTAGCEPDPPREDAGTADPDASPAVRAAYTQLVSAPVRPDNRLVIGQALRGWDFERPVDQPVTALTGAGLPAPKLLEVDAGVDNFGITAQHDQELYNVLLGHAAQGGLVGLTDHMRNPFTGGDVGDRNGVNLAELADPTNPQTLAGRRWQADLDRLAAIIQPLQDADVVVLFRPLHESNGNWFWWGQTDPAAFRATWKGMFDYLTGTKGLHNLLWVYSANRYLGDPADDPTSRFPGNDLVDVVGLDIYDNNLADTAGGGPGYAAMVALGKPFAITEYGASNWPFEHDAAVELTNAEVIQRIRDQYPATVIASAWYSQGANNWQISDKPDSAALLHDPWSITR